MSEYTSPPKKVAAGLPLWVMTFADLMTLLMCFFVLILSFSELDILKYKQLAGSMAHAFGVQRDIEAKDPPKGINIIAREFSPGQPQPTLMNVVRQKTVSDLRIHLEVGGHKTSPSPAPRVPDSESRDQVTRKVGKLADGQGGVEAGQQLSQAEIQELERLREEKTAIEQEREALRQREEELRARQEQAGMLLDDATAEEILAAREARERALEHEENARKILSELEEQILSGAVDVERDGQKIIIRIREKASFASGSAEVVAKFRPVLWRLGEIIEGMEGRIIVAGHTDPIPINTPRFRSNWELSSGRAVSVVHELLWQTAIPLERFLVQGHGETQPIAPNDTAANRAQNRRVEIILMQGDDREAEQEISRQGVGPRMVEEVVAQPQVVPAPESVTATPAEATEASPFDTSVSQAEVPATQPQAVVTADPASLPITEAPAAAAMASEEAPQAVLVTDEGAAASRPAVPERATGSGVTAGAVRPPRPPAVTGQQEAP
jgi:chemotaxis protein MotB